MNGRIKGHIPKTHTKKNLCSKESTHIKNVGTNDGVRSGEEWG